jgi:hypothetical protein
LEGFTKLKLIVAWVKLKAVVIVRFTRIVPLMPTAVLVYVAEAPEPLKTIVTSGMVSIRFQMSLYYSGKMMISPICERELILRICPVTVVKLKVYKLRTRSLLLEVKILLICKLAGGGEIESGKLTKPEDKTRPVPVELSMKENLNVTLVVEMLEFLILNIDSLKKSSLPKLESSDVIFETLITLLEEEHVRLLVF